MKEPYIHVPMSFFKELTPIQACVLAYLASFAANGKPILQNQQQLAEVFHVDRTTLTRTVGALKKKRLIVTHRTRKGVVITPCLGDANCNIEMMRNATLKRYKTQHPDDAKCNNGMMQNASCNIYNKKDNKIYNTNNNSENEKKLPDFLRVSEHTGGFSYE